MMAIRRLAVAVGGFALAAAAAAAPASAVEIQEVRGPESGIVAWLVEDRSVPVIAVRFAFRGGAALDPAGREGLARMASSLLDEGAGELDSATFQRRLEDRAISLHFDAGLDTFGGSLKTLTKNRDEAFELLGLALAAPRFDAEPVERMRAALLSELARNAEEPNYIASRAWWQTAFPGHPYGRPTDGTAASVASITAADLRGFVARRLARDNLVIGVVGDIDAATLAPLIDRTFAALPARAAADAVPAAEPRLGGEVYVIPRQIPQSVITFGQAGVKRNDPDYYTAFVLNYTLGGGSFSSRLYAEVREKRGLAYSVYSYLSPLDFAGLILGGVATQNARAKDSIELIRAEWARLAAGGVTAAELAAAKAYLTGSFPLRLDSTDRIAGILVAIRLDHLGIDYLDRRNSLIEAVTVEDVARVARRLLDPARLTFVVVGAPAGLAPNPPPGDRS